MGFFDSSIIIGGLALNLEKIHFILTHHQVTLKYIGVAYLQQLINLVLFPRKDGEESH